MDREGGSGGSCYYSILGIRQDASFSDIRAAYRKLALKWHPDRWAKTPSSAGEASRRFQKIQEAYSVLSDQGKRSMYDAGVLDLLDEDEGMNDFLHDLFSMMDDKQSQKNEVWKTLFFGMDTKVRRLKRWCFGIPLDIEEESLEDLQRTFLDLFGGDQTVRKRGWDGATNVNTSKHSKSVERCRSG